MSKSGYESSQGDYPPLVLGIPIFDAETVRTVIFDEELSLPSTSSIGQGQDALTTVSQPPSHTVPLELASSVHQKRKSIRLYMVTATVLMLLGLSLLVTAAIYLSNLGHSAQTASISIRELCAVSPSAQPWEPVRVIQIGQLDPVTMNNETVVGMKGLTMMETHSIWTSEIQIQYMDTVIQSLLLTNTGVLLSRQDPHIVMFSDTKDGSDMWRVTRDLDHRASMVDSNGDDVLVWFKKDVYLYSRRAESREHIASLEGVTSMKISQDGKSIFVATDDEILYFRRKEDRWVTGESLWYNTEKSVDEGRETQELSSQTHTELDVSADGSLLAIRTSTGHLLFYSFQRRGRQKLGGGGKTDATQISVSTNGQRVAVATSSGTVYVYEKRNDVMEVVAEILTQHVLLLKFFENRLQVIDGDNMTIYENQCDTIIKN
jgi:hypothetical protein